MKIVLEIEDKSYQTVLDFISLLPQNQCRVLPEETDKTNLPEGTKGKQIVHKFKHMVLPVRTTLLVALTIHHKADLNTVLQSHLKLRSKYHLGNDFYRSKLSVDTQFIEITISDPTTMQKESLEDAGGGVFLLFNGLSQTGILTSPIKLPIKDKTGDGDNDKVVDSLNYAFTCLSEEYEPWRKSHTGNIYDRIFYKEKNDKWYPIDVLRNIVSVKKDEHQLVFEARQEAIKKIQEWVILNKRN